MGYAVRELLKGSGEVAANNIPQQLRELFMACNAILSLIQDVIYRKLWGRPGLGHSLLLVHSVDVFRPSADCEFHTYIDSNTYSCTPVYARNFPLNH